MIETRMVETAPEGARAELVEAAHNAVARLIAGTDALDVEGWVYVLELVRFELLAGVFRRLYPEWFPSPHPHDDADARPGGP